MIPFVKAHACGNDFLVIDERFAGGQHAEVARQLCDRNTGVGADGIEFLAREEDGVATLRLINADGSEAELSGNGTRCVAAWLAYNEDVRAMTFHTLGGDRSCNVLANDGEDFIVSSGMGVPRVVSKTIAVDGVGEVHGVDVNVGNPHFVLFVETEDFSSHGMSWQDLGAKICVHPAFAKQTNVEFVRVVSEDAIEFRIFERGVGPTHSSGTGTCASSAAAIVMRGCARTLTATSIGGPQQVKWPADALEMELIGPASIVCVGEASVRL